MIAKSAKTHPAAKKCCGHMKEDSKRKDNHKDDFAIGEKEQKTTKQRRPCPYADIVSVLL